MLAVQEYDAEDSEGNVTRMWYILKVVPLESNTGFSLRQEDPEVYSNGGKMMGMAGFVEEPGNTSRCCPDQPGLSPVKLGLRFLHFSRG